MRTTRRTFLSLGVPTVAALGLGGCGPGYQIVRQAVPNPFRGQRLFALEPLRFDQMAVDGVPFGAWMSQLEPDRHARQQGDFAAANNRFAARLQAELPGVALVGPGQGDRGAMPFLIRAVVNRWVPGVYAYFFARHTELQTTAMLVAPGGAVLDQIDVFVVIPATLTAPVPSGRLLSAAEETGARVASYLHTRLARLLERSRVRYARR